MRIWIVARIAKAFGVLPSVVARDLDRDPEQISLHALNFLDYSEAYGAFKRGDKAELKAWKESSMMELVQEHAFADAEAELEGSAE